MLRELASKERPINDPLYAHLTQCSPCYRQFRSLQREAEARFPWQAATVAATILVLIVLVIGRERLAKVATNEPAKVVVQMEFDLRRFAVSRSETASERRQQLSFTRSRISAVFVLPVGSEAGMYGIQLLDESSRAWAGAAGEARILNGQTRLEAVLDLRNLAPGDYRLGVRRQGESWRMYPVRVE